MAQLPAADASLKDMQAYVKAVLHERGFDDEAIEEKFLLFTEEVGELAKAIRQNSKTLKSSAHSKSHQLDEEVGDVLILLLDLCNALGVDAAEALRYKEAINAKRTWQ